jgi:thioesterase domain-containing protein
LGLDRVGVHDDFFELGGHSLLAVSLFARIEKAFGKRLPLASLFQAPNVEALAKLLREEEPLTHWSSLVAIQPEGPRPPFYVVRAIGGNILNYRDIARHLPPDQPLYGLQAAGLDGTRPPHTRVEDMAADYIAEMRRLQPEGPYYLGGSSFGGLVAFEIAQQLRAQGQSVGLLALFDTFVPGHPRWLPASRGLRLRLLHIGYRIDLHASNLMIAAGPREKVAYILEKSKRLGRALGKQAKNRFEKIWEGLHPLPRELREVEKASHQSLRDYSPKPYLDRITLFRATKQPEGIYPDPTLGWSELALGGLEIHDIPGHHGSIVYEPRVGVLVERLQECLEKAYAATRGDSSNHGDGNGNGRREAAS